MASQYEVAAAFARGTDTPSRASNFRIQDVPDSPYTYLCGGRSGRRVVFARRRPITDVELLSRRTALPYGGMYYTAVRNQHREAVRAIRAEAPNDSLVTDVNTAPITVGQVPELAEHVGRSVDNEPSGFPESEEQDDERGIDPLFS